MTPETKAWFVKIKEQYFNKSDKNPTSILLGDRIKLMR